MIEKCRVTISPNIKKTSDRIDIDGNIIDPRTKQIIQQKESDSIEKSATPPPATPPNAPQAPIAPLIPKDDGLSVLDQIKATKARLQELEELKRLKIEEKKKELELLEKQ